jgi:transposase-like protein
MAKKARSEEQILRALHQAESGERVADICREHGVSESHVLRVEKEVQRPGPERTA